jgi:hypothetical protein
MDGASWTALYQYCPCNARGSNDSSLTSGKIRNKPPILIFS